MSVYTLDGDLAPVQKKTLKIYMKHVLIHVNVKQYTQVKTRKV